MDKNQSELYLTVMERHDLHVNCMSIQTSYPCASKRCVPVLCLISRHTKAR